MDITDHQSIKPAERKAELAYPTQPMQKEKVNELKTFVSAERLRHYNDMLSVFFNRYYTSETGVQAARKIHEEYTRLSQGNTNVEIVAVNHARFPQTSVIARIKGEGPLANELVIIGAHLDSTAGGATRLSPGADDDASGTCTLLELFRILMSIGWKPARTVEFHSYAGEEAGLLGSQDIAAQYARDGKDVYSMMQLDMTMYKGSNNQFGIITDFVDPDLTTFLRLLVDSYSNLNWVNSRCGYACSDHGSWTRSGFPSCFPFEGAFSQSNPNIHTANDVFAHLSVEHGLEFAYVALGYLIELAS